MSDDIVGGGIVGGDLGPSSPYKLPASDLMSCAGSRRALDVAVSSCGMNKIASLKERQLML